MMAPLNRYRDVGQCSEIRKSSVNKLVGAMPDSSGLLVVCFGRF